MKVYFLFFREKLRAGFWPALTIQKYSRSRRAFLPSGSKIFIQKLKMLFPGGCYFLPEPSQVSLCQTYSNGPCRWNFNHTMAKAYWMVNIARPIKSE